MNWTRVPLSPESFTEPSSRTSPFWTVKLVSWVISMLSVAPLAATMLTCPLRGAKMLLNPATTLKWLSSTFSTEKPGTSVLGSQDLVASTSMRSSPPLRSMVGSAGAMIAKADPACITSKVWDSPPAVTVMTALRAASSLGFAVTLMTVWALLPSPLSLSKVIQSLSALTVQGRSVRSFRAWEPPAPGNSPVMAVISKEPFWVTSKVSSSSPAVTVTVATRSITSLGSAVATTVMVRPSGSGWPFSGENLSQDTSLRTLQGTFVLMVKESGPPVAA